MKKYEVIEDNCGGLALAVFGENDTVEYIHCGYEHTPGQLRKDILAIRRGVDPESEWDGNCGGDDFEYGNDPTTLHNEITESEHGWKVVADNDRIYPRAMGTAARKELMEEES